MSKGASRGTADADDRALSLYLKHAIGPGNLLIIEEPEAHLGPRAQAGLARHVAAMIRGGLGVLITTHSGPLLEELGRLVLAGALGPAQRRKAGYGRDEFLRREEVAPYLFAAAGALHEIREIEMNGETGISQEEFIKADVEMHERHVRLQDAMEAGRGGAP